MSRSRLLFLMPVAMTVLVAAVVGGFVVVQNQKQSQQVERADDLAADYLSQVASWRAGIVTAVDRAARVPKGQTADPTKVRSALIEAADDVPRLQDAGTSGERESVAYVEAEQVAADLEKPYKDLSRSLKRADRDLEFVAAARKALALRVDDYVSGSLLTSSAPITGRLIPAFVRARDEFSAVTVPRGQGDLAAQVRGALQYVIDQSTILARRIDGGGGYSFGYADQFNAAITAVEDYATVVEGDLGEAVNAIKDL